MTPPASVTLLLIGHLALTTKRYLLTEKSKARSDVDLAQSHRMLGLGYQGQGQLDTAFDYFRKLPVDDSVMDVLYNLALDFERKRQFNKAESVFKYVADHNPKFRDVADRLGRAKAMSVTENALSAHSDLAGVFADNESSLAGAVQALKSRNNKQAKLVGFDASEQLVADLREGWIDSLVIQDPFKMGYESVKAIGEFRKGGKVNARLDLPARLVLPGELDRADVKDLLFPKLDQWLKTGSQH